MCKNKYIKIGIQMLIRMQNTKYTLQGYSMEFKEGYEQAEYVGHKFACPSGLTNKIVATEHH